MDNPNVEFTRDVAGALKERAEAQSMMAKHASAQREAMQEACLGALRKALPGASAETCLMALETANWDVDRAHAQVKAFMGAAATVAGAPPVHWHETSTAKRADVPGFKRSVTSVTGAALESVTFTLLPTLAARPASSIMDPPPTYVFPPAWYPPLT